MNPYKLFLSLCTLAFALSCSGDNGHSYIKGDGDGGNDDEEPDKEELVFQSGFGGSTQILQRGTSSNDDITGSERDVPNSSWDRLKTDGDIRSVYFNYTGGTIQQRRAEITDDPTGVDNKVLRFWIREAYDASEGQVKARVQLEFHNIQGGFKEFYQSVRVLFPAESFNALRNYPNTFDWLTISEFWNNEWWDASEKHGFRISLSVRKPDSGADKDLYFGLTAEDMGFVDVWNCNESRFKIPIGKWFRMDYYYREGDKNSGRFYMTVTPDGEEQQVVFDIRDFTHNTTDTSPDGVTAYNPLKLYTSHELMLYMKSQGIPLEIYWDDLKLWKNKRPSEQ